MHAVQKCLGAALVAALLAAPASVMSASVEAAGGDTTLATDLDARLGYIEQVLTGKNVRHGTVAAYMSPLFMDADGRDRFLLNMVARIKKRGLVSTRVRRMQWAVSDLDAAYGFATADARLCGLTVLWLPRCVQLELRWRRVEDTWYLLPPNQIILDPIL